MSRGTHDGFNAAVLYCVRATKLGEQMDETERHDRQSRILVLSESVHGDLAREVGNVFDTARRIASVFQQRAAHSTLCWFDSSDSCKDQPPAICGRVERSKQFEISDSLGVVSQRNFFFVIFFLLPKHFGGTMVETSTC